MEGEGVIETVGVSVAGEGDSDVLTLIDEVNDTVGEMVGVYALHTIA